MVAWISNRNLLMQWEATKVENTAAKTSAEPWLTEGLIPKQVKGGCSFGRSRQFTAVGNANRLGTLGEQPLFFPEVAVI